MSHSRLRMYALHRARNSPEPRAAAARLSRMDDIAHLDLLDDDEIKLDVAALELAALDHPGASVVDYLDRLGEVGEDGNSRLWLIL